jgi:hypothetical protein
MSNNRSVRGSARVVVIVAVILYNTAINTMLVTASPRKTGIFRNPFARHSLNATPEIPTKPAATSFQRITRGGGAIKLKGSATPTASNTSKGTKKMVKKMKKKRVVAKQATPLSTNKPTPVEIDNTAMNKMPSIFRPEEEKYDRYSAALAVTEGLRRVRDAEIEKRGGNKKKNEEKKKNAESEFLLQTTKAVKALGLTVAQFNEIGREVLGDEVLKERVSCRIDESVSCVLYGQYIFLIL